MLYCRFGRLDFLCVHTLSRRGRERGEAAGYVRAAEGRVRGRAQGSRDDQQRASQDGAHGGRGQAAGGRGRALHHQPAGGLQRGRNEHHSFKKRSIALYGCCLLYLARVNYSASS